MTALAPGPLPQVDPDHPTRAAVLDYLREHGPRTRADIARHLNLSPPTISRVVRPLLREGYLSEREFGASSGGRRPIVLEHNPHSASVIGVDIGGSKVLAAVSDLDGHVQHLRRFVLPPTDPRASLEMIIDVLRELMAQAAADGSAVRAVGLGVPGVVDAAAGVALWVPSLGWRDLHLQRIVEDRLGLGACVENDVNLGALGEQWRGVGRGLNNLVYVFVGTGIGAGVVLDGRVIRGAHHAAGEVGYLLLDRTFLDRTYPGFGAFESDAAAPGILRRARARAGERWADARQVFDAARRGDADALAVVDETIDWLALGLANIACVLDPQAIVLGGGVAGSADLLLEPIRSRLEGRIPSVPMLSVSELGERAVLTGAVALAVQRLNAYIYPTNGWRRRS
jgi:predicted NBD/HSP70 family sugar kinase